MRKRICMVGSIPNDKVMKGMYHKLRENDEEKKIPFNYTQTMYQRS